MVKEGRRERGRKKALRRRALTPTVLGDPPSQPHLNPVTPPETTPPNAILALGVRVPYEFGVDKNMDPKPAASGRLAII